jgi:hypothetical protein
MGGRVKRVQIPWAREELILACDLVRQNGWHELRQTDREVRELSELLQIPFVHPLEGRPENFRSPNSVSRKTSDLMTRLPHYRGKPTKGGRLDGVVLDEFLADPDGMSLLAARLREDLTTDRWRRGTGARPASTPARPAGAAAAADPAAAELPLKAVTTDPRPQIDPSSAEARIARSVVASAPFQAQVARAGRGALSVDLAYSLLARLLVDGGRTPSRRLMASADLPERSAEPTLAVMRRLLNLDGSAVVSLDVDGVTVRLDRAALVEQFGIRGG